MTVFEPSYGDRQVDLTSGSADLLAMNTLVQIVSQIAWGVTIGALTAAATFGAKLLVTACGLAGSAWCVWRWRKGKRSGTKR